MKIGILALQGGLAEHINHLKKNDIQPVLVKRTGQLQGVKGLILPGGESTAIGKLLIDNFLLEPLSDMIKNGLPVWGTCAGMILLARELINEQYRYFALMDIAVRRNAYGSQLDSFKVFSIIPGVSKEMIPLVFIRAPIIEKIGEDVEVLLKVNGKIVMAQQKNMLVTSFHPELTDDYSIHKYFIKFCSSRG